ncbi:DUF6892 domain-containing protein [Undibacterium sp. Di27W]|uniref:DUF6892 domain-containing protein n=1 Tax=Undibacterium sp. Di27W TaxID=3413036 RepID=UPI003BF04C05
MISKDLLYALQTRSKHMTRLLEDFSGDIKKYSEEEGWLVVAETMEVVKKLAPTQAKYTHIIKAINRAWLVYSEQSPLNAHRLYDAVIKTLAETTWTSAEQAQVAYQLLYAFHDNHLHLPGSNKYLHLALRRHSPFILDLIKNIVAYSTQTLFTMPVKPHTGIGADAIEILLEIYYYHLGIDQADDLRADASGLLFALVQANPDFGNIMTLALLEHAPERSTILSQLIDFYLINDVHKNREGMFYNIMLDLVDNSGSSFIYDDLDKITRQLEVFAKKWTASQFDAFAQYAFFYRLSTDEDRRLLLKKSKKVMRLLKMIVDSGHAGTHIDALRALHQVMGTQATDQAMPSNGRHQFKDLNFKLLVIQELMYVQEKLLPRFDVHEFIRQHTDREIMIEKEGYDVIPEVLAYFENLLIPPSLLAQVDKLAFDGGNKIYHQIFPYWDGECDTFDVTFAEDIKLVPHLKRMSSMPTRFIELHGVALSKKSIELSYHP